MKHWIIIIDKGDKKLTKKSGDNMTDDGKYDKVDFNVAHVPGTIGVEYYKSMERSIDFREYVTVTNTDIGEVTISDNWEISVVESGVPKH